MTEQAAETQAAATETGEEQQPTETKPTETVEFWKQKAREQEKRAKDNATAATKLAEYEDRDKTEAQKLTERADAAEKLAASHEARALRLEVASEKGLTPAQVKRLVGSTREELEADADDLLENFKPSSGDAAPSVAADIDLGQRGTSTTATSEQDAAKWLQTLTRQ
jgi:hypothetical protein